MALNWNGSAVVRMASMPEDGGADDEGGDGQGGELAVDQPIAIHVRPASNPVLPQLSW